MSSSSSFFSGTNPTPTEYQTAVNLVAQATQQATAALASQEAAATSAQSAQGYSTAAGSSATSAANQASSAATSSAGALTYKTAAETAATNAASSATTAGTQATTATTQATNASNSASAASTSATAAATSATNAASSSTAAGTSATNASNSASAASTSATNAANSATAAAGSASTATTQATTATNQAATATTQATNASNSATAAGTSATNAANSATAASTSATNAATSATNAASSATAAAGSASAASTSATDAATSASNAASTLAGALTKTDNLGSLSNVSTARTNLGLTALATTTPGTNVATALTNATNAASGVVQLTSLGKLPALDGSALTGLLTSVNNSNWSGTQLSVANGGTGLTSLTAGYIPFGAGTSAFGNDSNLFWDNSNKLLGIGTSSPSYKIDISAANDSTARVRLVNTTGYNLFWSSNTGGGTFFGTEGSAGGAFMSSTPAYASVITSTAATPLCFGVNTTEAMRIASDGSVGIGTTSPAYNLDVRGGNAIIQAKASATNGGAILILDGADAGSYPGVVFKQGGTHYWSIQQRADTNLYLWREGGSGNTIIQSGNLGLGVAPSAWSAGKAFEIGSLGTGLSVGYGLGFNVTSNAYYNGAFYYGVNGPSTRHAQQSGEHRWFTAPPGTANAAITFTQAMTLDASGNLGVGTGSNAISGQLEVAKYAPNTTGPQLYLTNTGNGYPDTMEILFKSGSDVRGIIKTVVENNPYYGQLQFYTGRTSASNLSTPRMVLDGSGNLLVGTTSNPLAASVKGYFAGNLAATCLFSGNGSAGSATGFFNADTWFIQNEAANVVRSYSCGTTGNSAYGTWIHYAAKSAGTPIQVFSASNGAFAITGALSKSSGTFKIDHPLPELTDTHHLVHSFIEGPQADLIYRGVVKLVNGKATVNIDEASNMTDGTFVLLCREVQCFTCNETDWDAVRGKVTGNILTIESQNSSSSASISWLVIGERQDKHMYETGWTDDNGKVIVEPLKDAEVTSKVA